MASKTKNKLKSRTARRPAVTRPRTRIETVPVLPADRIASFPKLPLLLCLALAASVLVLYSGVGRHPFINYDDQAYVFQNTHVMAGLKWSTLTWALTATEASNWHPITWVSHALDCQLFGLSPAGHHWMNVIIHALNTVLLFLLLWRATGAIWRSLLVAALFALHPLNVESVAWVAERKSVLSTLFFLLALGAYGHYARKPQVRRYLTVALLFVLGLASKPMVITLPFVLMILDYWPLGRIEGWSTPSTAFPVPQMRLQLLLLEKLPLLALSAGSAIITMIAQTQSEISSFALPFGVRVGTAFYAYGMYLWKAIWPVHLALIYPHPGRTLAMSKPLVSSLIILAALAVGWKQRFTRPYWAAGWLWYLGTAVPIIGIVQVGVQVVADRYAYLTLIGIFVAVVWEISALADQVRVGVPARTAVASVILVALAFTSFRQIGYWKSTADVWTHALQVTENNSIAENALATEMFTQGRYQEGIAHLRNYTRLEPLDPTAHARVGADYQDHGQLTDAIREFETAVRGSATLSTLGQPGLESNVLAMTYANLAICYAQLGDQMKAKENARQAAQTDANAIGEMINGLAQYLRQHPAASGYVRLGLLLQQFDKAPEAQQAFAKAHQLDSSLTLPTIAETVQR
jgi:protein O-mannosyl-transferase